MKSVPGGVVAAILLSLVACDRPDARPGVRLVSTSPADGATKVGVHEPIVLTFSGPLDPATIHGNTVKLRRPGELVSPAPKLTYDPSTYTVTVRPPQPMPWGDQQVVVMGLEDPYGDSVLRTKVSFRTWMNPVTDVIEYGAAAVLQWRFENDEEGRPIREFASSAGADWYWRDNTYGEHGRLTRSVTHAPGDDAVWGYEEYAYDELGNPTGYTSYSGAGQVLEYGTTVYDQLGNATHGTAAQGTPTGYWWLATYDGFGNRTGYYEATSPGFDGTLGSADDVSPVAWATEWDGRGTLLAYTRLAGTGPDGLWLTPDDVTADSLCHEFRYDQAGNTTHDLWYGAGTDNRCFTGDETDWFKTGFEYAYDADGRTARAVEYVLGVRTGCTTTSYAANGNRTRVVTYGAGNGICFDADDKVAYESLYDPTK